MIIKAFLALALMVVSFGPASAGPGDDCHRSQEPDIKINGCTILLQQPAPAQRRSAQYNTRCIAYGDKGDYPKAVDDCTKSIEFDPRNAFAFNNRCLYLGKLGQFDRAIADCNKSLELGNPGPQNPMKHRADAYVGKGEFDLAIADYRKAVDLMPSFDLAKQALLEAMAARDQRMAAGAKVVKREQVDIVPVVPHAGWVAGVAFSPDGMLIASGGEDGKVKIWDVRSRRLVRTIRGHEGGVSAVAFTPDGQSVLSGGRDTGLKLWDVRTGRFIRHYFGHGKAITGLAISRDGTRIASASFDQTVVIWNFATQKRLLTFKEHKGSVMSVTFSRDGSRVLSGASTQLYPERKDFTAKLWDAETGRVLRTFQHANAVNAVALSPDGMIAVTGSEDKTVKMWNTATGTVIRSMSNFEYGVSAIAFSSDGRLFFAGGIGVLKAWESSTGKLISTFEDSGARSLAVNPEGSLLAVGTSDNEVKLWRLEGERIAPAPAPTFALGDVPVSLSPAADPLRFAVGTSSKLHLWQVPNGVQSVEIPATHVAYSRDASNVLAGGSKSLAFVDAGGQIVQTFAGIPGDMDAIAISHDNRRVAAGLGFQSTSDGVTGEQGRIKIWDAISGGLLRTLSGHPSGIGALAFSPDGALLVSGGYRDGTHDAVNGSGKMRFWNPATGQLIRTVDAHFYKINALAFSPDGAQIVTGSGYDPIAQGLLVKTLETVRLWDAKSGRLLHSMGPHADVVATAFSPDGKHVLSGSNNNELMLWDVATGQLVRRFDGHSGGVNAVQFSRDGRLILSASQDRTVRIWNRNTGDLLTTVMGDQKGWIAVTQEGFFANSSPDDATALTVARGIQLYDINQMYQALYEPDLVREKILGDPDNEVAKAAAAVDIAAVLDSGAAPVVTLGAQQEETREALLSVSAHIKDQGGGIGKIEWRLNGVTVAVNGTEPAPTGERVITQTLALDEGANTIEVVAYNGKNLLSSSPTKFRIRMSDTGQNVKPTLHVLSIGINKYEEIGSSNRSRKAEGFEPLKLAVNDANAVADTFVRAGASRYREVKTVRLTDAQARRDEIEAAIDRLSVEVQPRDTFILFVAAHGISHGGKFFLIPQDFRGGPDSSNLEANAIGQDQIQNWIARIKAKYALVLLDTCESGALVANRSTTNLNASDAAVGRLHQATGRPVLTAAAEGKPAFEGYKGHGIFTWALLDALKNGDRNANGVIELSELVAHVQSEVLKISALLNGRGRAAAATPNVVDELQSARFGSRGENFALVDLVQ